LGFQVNRVQIPISFVLRLGFFIIRNMKTAKYIILVIFLAVFACPGYGDKYPERIISLGPVITEELYSLGAGDETVAVTDYCVFPQQARKKEKVGTLTDINMEKVLALKPDIVFATALTNPRQVQALKKLGVRVEVFPYYRNFNDICGQFMRLAEMIGEQERAKQIITAAKEKVKHLRKQVTGKSPPRVFVQIGARPLFTVTGDSFINDYIEMGGGINVAADLAKSGLYSREEVVRQNPDIIIIAAMGIREQEEEEWQRFPQISAVAENRIYTMDPYRICSSTPENYPDTLKELIQIFHPQPGKVKKNE